ncbi:DNA methyltransferase [Pedobacter sp. WC2423]|uniref:DNA methyltransferase n=1 Tax=Pedobacter sp. WC2423 TaxID=3234142 RepID=UPI003466F334
MTLSDSLIGDTLINADCLSVLERLSDKTVDLVYLDPPWNIGNDFTYYSNPSNSYEEFIFEVLQHAKRILKDDGNVVFHSLPSLNINFHNLISPIFGSENFRAEFILPIKNINFGNKTFKHTHETIVNYVLSDKSKFNHLVEKSKKEIEKVFQLKDNKGRFRLQPIIINGDSPSLNFEWNGFELPNNKIWRYSKSKLDELNKMGKLFYEGDMKYPTLKVYSDEYSLQNVETVWHDIPAYELKRDYAGQQNEKLLNRIINLFSNEGDLVIDPFSGTGTSGVSSINLGRKWFGIEKSKIGYDIAFNRIAKLGVISLTELDIVKYPIIFNDYNSINESEADILSKRIKKGENSRLEFKEMYLFNHYTGKKDAEMPNKIMQEVSAFLNSKFGGTILIGVSDKGNIVGIDKDFEHVNPQKQNIDGFELSLTNKIKDTLGSNIIDAVSLSFVTIEEKIIAKIDVSPTIMHVFYENDFYVRNGTSSVKLKVKEYHDLMQERKFIL